MSAVRVAAGVVAAIALLGVACSTPQPDARFLATPPDSATFPAETLVQQCGTLDCHGTAFRNMQLYGAWGRRLSLGDLPLRPKTTTAAELAEDYGSVVGLEPEVMSAVAADKGASPERLSIIRKARGQDNHKGGTLSHQGDDLDVCMTSWLAGATDMAACGRVTVVIP